MRVILGQEFVGELLPKIRAARNCIRICVYDWRWYAADPANPAQIFNHALVEAVRRGVKVLAVTNDDRIIDTLSSVGIEVRKITSRNLLHAKCMLIDDEIAIIGSHNYTQNAFTTNFEVSVLFDEIESVLRLKKWFSDMFIFA
jgi:phosphatidylserine/phosphatidylglycerophosphate/cardiolipin synthase-like enzyme